MANKIFTSESWDEFSTGIANLKTKINNIINGTQVVSKATTATNAGTATYATTAGSASKATTASNAGTATTLKDLTATVAELNYVDGVTSAIQTQLDAKMKKANPTGTGSFSLNRKSGTDTGLYSSTLGNSCTANGMCTHAEGYGTIATGDDSHAEGNQTIASGDYQHVQGRFNIEDTNNKYAHIVGNGETGAPSNAHTLDWGGNGWFAGDVYVGGTDQSKGTKLSKEGHTHTSATSSTYASTATKAGSASTATVDSKGQNITGYIKGFGISGKTITITKGDGSTATYTTQDTNTTYANYKGATTASSGTAGLVPAATKATRTSFLRGDGTWATPTNTKVAQTELTSNSNRSILLASNNTTASATTGTYKSTKLKYNPSTDILTVGTVKGNLTGLATSATSDANGNNIANTYATKSSLVAVTTAQIDTLFT